MSEPIIDVKSLRKVYGKGDAAVNALDGVDLQILPGEFVAIMGPSGSGKSTLMNIIGCLDIPTSGEYYLNGKNVSQLDKNNLAGIRNNNLGFIFQSFNLLPRLTAVENVMLPMIYQHNNTDGKQTQKVRAQKMLEIVGLGERLHHRPSELSGGQQQRVAIARALINNPSVILADEPTGNLDSHSNLEILNILHQLHDQGATIVMVTHAFDVAKHADRVINMLDGKITSDDKEKNKNFLETQPVEEMGVA